MKAQKLYLSLFLSLFFISSIRPAVEQAQGGNPLLVVLLMVWNEKDVIIPTLESYLTKDILAGKDNGEVAYVICGGGQSTDGTLEIAQEFLEKKKIKHSLVTCEPWVDFSTNRNACLKLVRTKFPQSTFILFVDAEWYIRNMDELVNFCKEEAAKAAQGAQLPCYYRIMIKRPGTQFGQQRLFLTHDDVEFEGPCHEIPTKYANASVPKNVYIDLGWSKNGSEKSQKRWYRDRDLLLKDLLAHPTNVRSCHYLAKTEMWLGNYRNAYTYFKIRTGMNSFPEEDYEAQYYLAVVTEILAGDDQTSSCTWEEALKYYLKAFTMRPHRAEPLIKIAWHYLNENNYALSYVFARRAYELPFPENDVLPIEKNLYDFDRHEIVSRCAWYLGEYGIGEEAAKKAIAAHPNSPYLYRNLAFYWERQQ